MEHLRIHTEIGLISDFEQLTSMETYSKLSKSSLLRSKIKGLFYLMGYLIIVVLLITLILVLNDINNRINNGNSNDRRKLLDEVSNSCDNSEIDLNIAYEETIKNTRQLTSKILPGIQFFTYSYNLLQGKTPFDLLLSGNYHQIFKLSFDDNKITAGSKAYRVPDELDLPAFTGVCFAQSQTSSFSSATSTATLYQANKESTQSDSGSASVSAHGWGFSGKASLSMSLTHSKSSGISTSLSYARQGKTQVQFTYSQALLYSARIRWNEIVDNCNVTLLPSFLKDVRHLEKNIRNKAKIVQFLGTWGTHVLKLGKLGSHCKQSTYFTGGFSQASYEKSSEHAGSNNNNYGSSVSGSGGGFGFHASVSASYEHSSGSSYSASVNVNGEKSESAEYSQETTYCAGEVDITSICGGMLGTQDEPSLVGYEMQPIWNIEIFSVSVKNNIQRGVESIIHGGLTLCGGIAIPAANFDFWNDGQYLQWKESDRYSPFHSENPNKNKKPYYASDFYCVWDETICFDQYSLGLLLLTTGNNVNNPLNVSNNYVRKEFQKVNYEQFCQESDKVMIALTLQSFPGKARFGIELANKQKDSFTVDFYVDENQITDIGSASYLILCDDIKSHIYTGSFTTPAKNGSGWLGHTHSISISNLPLKCSDNVYNIRVGMKSVPKYRSTLIDSIDIVSSYTSSDISITAWSWHGLNVFDITYIIHCNNERILASGDYEFDSSNFIQDTSSIDFNPTVVKTLITYQSGVCSNVRIWLGIRRQYNTCNVAIWYENPTSTSFDLVLAIWQSDKDEKCRISNNSGVRVVKVDYIVFCSAE